MIDALISNAMNALQFMMAAPEAGHRRLDRNATKMKLMLFAIVMCLVIALLALCWFHLVNSDAGESPQARAVGGRGGPKRRSRSKSADGDVEAPADEVGEADVVAKEEEGGCRIA